jgi:ABC-2 type transport system permease protein
MNKISIVWGREFRSFWSSPIAYIIIIAFLALTNFLYFRTLFLEGQASLRGFFELLPWTFLLILPALTMGQWAEERKTGTIEPLLVLPVTEWQVVLGKYLASVSLLLSILVLTLPLVLTVKSISQNGIDVGQVAMSYFGALLLGASYLAIGSWVSSFSDNQIVAFILTLAAISLLLFVGLPFVTYFVQGSASVFFQNLGLIPHYSSLGRGVLDVRDLLYFGSVIYLFSFLTTRTVESRKWS